MFRCVVIEKKAAMLMSYPRPGRKPQHLPDEAPFRPIRKSWKVAEPRRPLDPDVINWMLRKYARKIGIKRGFSAHSMRAKFITRTLENGASLEEVQRAAGHADASTTKLYDRRRYNPEKSASFFANY